VSTDERLNSFEDITSYNNFDEFGHDPKDPQRYAGRMKTSPWTVKIDGLCNAQATYLLEDVIRPHQLEERIYRHRCVEAWSMVIPWVGVPLSAV
jgi:sulfoxide reductase catalytic subunit YedY